jgi:hypothetical protein
VDEFPVYASVEEAAAQQDTLAAPRHAVRNASPGERSTLTTTAGRGPAARSSSAAAQKGQCPYWVARVSGQAARGAGGPDPAVRIHVPRMAVGRQPHSRTSCHAAAGARLRSLNRLGT